MRTFAQKSKAVQRGGTAGTAKPVRRLCGQRPEIRAILQQKRPQLDSKERGARPDTPVSAYFGRDVSRIPMPGPLPEKGRQEPVPPGVHAISRSPGHRLNTATSAFFESRFGHDFSHVRIHTSGRAAAAAHALNARAFTVGKDIGFAAGQYSPNTMDGQRLLAHELVHTIQQGPVAGRGTAVYRAPRPAAPLKGNSGGNIRTADWGKVRALAEKFAKRRATKRKALAYYKSLIIRAAAQVTPQKPLPDKKPGPKDIRWSWRRTSKYSAVVDPKRVDNYPNNFWKWVMFNPGAVTDNEAFTVSAIVHELDHAAHAKALYDAWKQKGKKRGWDAFYIRHFQKWAEKPIPVGTNAGMLGAIAGLPSRIRPSVIEFRAYTNQLIQFFHKLPLDGQDLVVKGAILHYPLKKQTVKARIFDPALNLATARKKLLDYFRAPPIADKKKQRTVKVLLASNFKSVLTLFRPGPDSARMRKDFSDIINFRFTRTERRKARRTYKPEP